MRGLAATVAWLALAGPVLANDSTAELRTGGLDFVRNEDVEMRSEELFVSMTDIRVAYHFFNKSEKPITNLVAFPMPDITIADQDTNISIPTREPVNFLAFATEANGQPVAAEVEQKVLAKRLDRTELLRRLNVPLAPHLAATYVALDGLPRDKWQELVDLGIAEIVEYAKSPSFKMEPHLEARWTLKTTYYWRQTFPAQQELVIEHRYKPSVGATAGVRVGPQIPDTRSYAETYCMEPTFIAGIGRAQRALEKIKDGYLSERRVAYILKTGANWAGPIADFTLTVDKGKPDNLVSFCGNDIKKLSPTQFQVHYRKFTPDADLAVLFVIKNVPE